MKTLLLALSSQIVCAMGFSQNLSLAHFGTPFQESNLVVHWDTATNTWPSKVWIYHLSPNHFSKKIISHLMTMCSFTDKDKVQADTNGMVFKNSDPARLLTISFPDSSVHYETTEIHYGPTNLAKGVPGIGQMPKLTERFVSKMGIEVADIEKKTNGAPDFRFWEPYTWYFVGSKTVTNIAFRAFTFSRAVDGMTFIGSRGECRLQYGEYGKLSGIDFSWPNIKRYKNCPFASRETIVRWMREGKARQGFLPDNVDAIDWSAVRSVTIKNFWPSYYAGERNSPSEWLMPYLALWTIVDTGKGKVEVEIDCPVMDETNQ